MHAQVSVAKAACVCVCGCVSKSAYFKWRYNRSQLLREITDFSFSGLRQGAALTPFSRANAWTWSRECDPEPMYSDTGGDSAAESVMASLPSRPLAASLNR